MLDLVFGAIDVLIASVFLPYFIALYHRTGHRFYLFWGIGVCLAGLRLAARLASSFYPFDSLLPYSALLLLLLMGALLSVIAGIGELVSELKQTVIAIGVVPLIMVSFYLLAGMEEFLVLSNIGLYTLVCILLLHISRKYHLSLHHILLGLSTLFLANFAYQFQFTDAIYIEAIGILGKITLFIGVLQPRFRFLAYDMSGLTTSQALTRVNEERMNGSLILLESAPESKRAELKLLTDRLKNHTLDSKAILVVLYDLITFTDLEGFGVDPDSLHIVRMLSRNHSTEPQRISQKNESVIRDDLDDLNLILSEILKANNNGTICEIFFYNLSALVNLHGFKRIYSFLISIIPRLKTNAVSLNAFLHPKTHENRSEVATLESLADEIQQI